MLRDSLQTTVNFVQDAGSRIRRPLQQNKKPTILMFHSVSERAEREWGPWQYAVTPEEFDDQIEAIADRHKIISLDALTKWFAGQGSIPDEAIVVTFDDGYRDFVTEVLPILENHEVPATVYVSTSLLGSKAPFEQRLGEALLSLETVDVEFGGVQVCCSLDSQADVVSVYNSLREVTKHARMERREALLSRLNSDAEPVEQMISPEAVRDLAKHPLVTIGSHGHHHVPFRILSADEVIENVETSISRLSSLLGQQPRHFSFPYGSHTREAIRIVRSRGFESVATTEPRPVRPQDWSRRTVPRYDGATNE